MNTAGKYKIHVRVDPPFGGEPKVFNLDIDPQFHKEILPIHTCSDDTPIGFRLVTGNILEDQAVCLKEDRRDLAKRLAVHIAKSLVEAMEADDAHNGYLKNARSSGVEQ